MSYFELVLLSLSLAMDCFAVSCTTGTTQPKLKAKYVLFFAFSFGFFQAIMPLIGWFFGEVVIKYLSHFTNWIAFGILAFIGGKMIFEAIQHKDNGGSSLDMTKLRTVLLLSIATSIDALAVGFGFSMMQKVNIYWAVFNIGIMSFVLSIIGYTLTKKIGNHIKAHYSEIIGGVILILIGIKILIGL